MNNFLKLTGYLINLVAGCFLIPALCLGVVLATNSSKGWNVQNIDGLLFIPLGVLILIASVLIPVMLIVKFILLKNKSISKYLPLTFYTLGILVYLLFWLLK